MFVMSFAAAALSLDVVRLKLAVSESVNEYFLSAKSLTEIVKLP